MNWSQSELQEAFNKVKNPVDWKDRINAVIDESDRAIVHQAVIHFTATRAVFTKARGKGKLRVKAVGYRMGPCGDY